MNADDSKKDSVSPANISFMAEIEIIAIRSAQRGDEDAWRKLFDWHFDAVYRYAMNLASGRQDFAEEITQQVFFIAARSIRKFDPEMAAFRSWLHGIARNCFMKIEKKEASRKFRENQLRLQQQPQQRDEPDYLNIYDTLAVLPLHYRAVLQAKYFDKLSVKEIAVSQGCSVKAAESMLARARKEFERLYKFKFEK